MIYTNNNEVKNQEKSKERGLWHSVGFSLLLVIMVC